MPAKLFFATTNEGKRREAAQILEPLGVSIEIVPVKIPVAEDGLTFEENAGTKAAAYARELRAPVVADDSGIEIEALNGLPGVDSAIFSSLVLDKSCRIALMRPEPSLEGFELDEANNRRLLEVMAGRSDRLGRYVCVLALAQPNGEILHLARGETQIVVGSESRGTNGFGYDRIVHLQGDARTIAELDPAEKNAGSHRMRAWLQLIERMKR